MRIAVASDHRGYRVKMKVAAILQEQGCEVDDEGVHSEDSADYPDYAAIVAKKVSCGEVDRGILVCSTGIGMAIAANKLPGVRAATCNDAFSAEMSRRHNDLNVLCLAADVLSFRQIEQLLEIWLNTEFEGGRHARRIGKITQMEDDLSACETRAGE